ncbi:hypothetical protein CRUP_031038 [Coryphaenoides rupestris]|nr:hypothetical protein CRUP_031038 [Coryphaenoides rupestris]
MFGFRPKCNPELLPTGAVITAPRPSLTVRKRLRRVTRVILAVLPRPVRSAMGYPVSTSIGCSVSPEIRISPTKPSGKGNKRKQDEDEEEDEEDEEEVEQPTWVDALTQELAEDPSAVETESEEYCSHNNTGDSDADILIPIDDVVTS